MIAAAPSHRTPAKQSVLRTPVRNRYFYGQLLGVEQFNLETDYLNDKRWLLNRLVSGYGVVCGLDVLPGDETDQIIVTPGVAIDKWGREIIVTAQTAPVTIPPAHVEHGAQLQQERQQQYQQKRQEDRAHAWVQVLLCYKECPSDPVPVMAGDCNCGQTCAPSTIQESFCIDFKAGPAPWPDCGCRFGDAISGNGVDHGTLARWVTQACPELPADPCIPLANVRIIDPEEGHQCDRGNIDIEVRPIVYTADMLYELLVCLALGPGAASYRK